MMTHGMAQQSGRHTGTTAAPPELLLLLLLSFAYSYSYLPLAYFPLPYNQNNTNIKKFHTEKGSTDVIYLELDINKTLIIIIIIYIIIINRPDKRKIEAAEMRFLRPVAGYTLLDKKEVAK